MLTRDSFGINGRFIAEFAVKLVKPLCSICENLGWDWWTFANHHAKWTAYGFIVHLTITLFNFLDPEFHLYIGIWVLDVLISFYLMMVWGLPWIKCTEKYVRLANGDPPTLQVENWMVGERVIQHLFLLLMAAFFFALHLPVLRGGAEHYHETLQAYLGLGVVIMVAIGNLATTMLAVDPRGLYKGRLATNQI